MKKEAKRFPWLLFLVQIAYVIWIFFKTYKLSRVNDDDAALFYRISLIALLLTGFFINFSDEIKKYRKVFLIVPFSLWMVLIAGGMIKDYSPEEAAREKLFKAAESGKAEKILSLQEKHEYSRDTLETAMWYGIYSDNPGVFRAANELGLSLDSPSRPFDPEQTLSWPWIHQAAEEEALDVMTYLLEAGIPVDSADPRGITPLMVAADRSRPGAVEFLISQGAYLEAVDDRGYRAIEIGVLNNWGGDEEEEKKVFDLFVQAGSDTEKRNRYGHTLLNMARYPLDDYLESLGYESGAELDFGETDLHKAAERGDLKEIRRILDNDEVFIDFGDRDEWRSPLFYSLYNLDNTPALKLLVDRGADVNLPDKNGITPLMYGCYNIWNSSVSQLYLLDHGADPFMVSNEGFTVMDFLMDNSLQDFTLWKALIERGVPVDRQVLMTSVYSWYQTKDYTLHYEEDISSAGRRRKLAALDADLAWIWQKGESSLTGEEWGGPLLAAAEYNNLPCFQIALSHGGSLDYEYEDVSVTRRILIEDGLELMKYLVAEDKAWQNLAEDQERLNHVFHESVVYGSIGLAEYFMDLGADIHSRGDVFFHGGEGTPVLFEVEPSEPATGSSFRDKEDLVVALYKLLIQRGADLKAVDKEGDTVRESLSWRNSNQEKLLLRALDELGIDPEDV